MVFRFCRFFKGFERFLYKDKTRKYDPKAHEKHPITVRPSPFHRLHTAQKSPVSEGEEHRQDEIDESHKSRLKFEYEVYLLNCTKNKKKPLKT